MAKKEFPMQQVLELACAAQRVNGEYLKEAEDEEICNENESSYNYLKESNNSMNSVNKKELFDAK